MSAPSVFQFERSLDFLRAWVDSRPPKQKRGAYRRLAEAAGVFPSYFSQILRGDRSLNLDQAMGLTEFLGLRGAERRYFLRWVELDRAATQRLRDELRSELAEIRSGYFQIGKQVEHERAVLGPEDLQAFYSSWHYVAIRLLTSIPGHTDARTLARTLRLPKQRVERILEFLLRTGLCQEENGEIRVGPAHMHLEHDSPLIRNHHANWRQKAMEKHAFLDADTETAYSLVATLSSEDALKIRAMILEFVKSVRQVSDPSTPEKMYFLNLDWLEV